MMREREKKREIISLNKQTNKQQKDFFFGIGIDKLLMVY